MRYVTFSRPEVKSTRAGVVIDEWVVDLKPLTGQMGLPRLINMGAAEWQKTHQAIENYTAKGITPSLPEVYRLDEVTIHAPLRRMESLRDFYAFEQHVKTANQNRGREVPPAWYEIPVFYFSNHAAIFGDENTIPYPPRSTALDYELEIACVIGTRGINIAPEDAEKHIFGYMIFNDWSARDLQRQEMSVGLGPSKGKDFASSFGPYLVTPDELADRHTGRPGVYDLAMVARVNGEEKSRGNFTDIYYSFGQLIAHASEEVWLYPGDVIGTGTVGTGCLLEITKGQGPWLQPGDVVELEVERLGVLQNTIGQKETASPSVE